MVTRAREQDRVHNARGTRSGSLLATRAAIVAAVFGTLLVTADRISSLFTGYVPQQPDILSASRTALGPLVAGVVLLAVVTIVVGVVATLAQNRAVARGEGLRDSAQGFNVRGSVAVLVQVCLLAVISLYCAYWAAPHILYALRMETGDQIGAYFYELALKICKLVVVVAAVLAILAVFVYRAALLIHIRTRGALRD